MPHVSASLLAPSGHGNPSQVGLRMHALGAQPLREVGDVRLVLDSRVRERRAARRGRRIVARGAVDAVHALGLAVVGLEVGVAERPGRRRALVVLDGPEVVLAEAREAGPVHLRVAAHHVVHARGERAARAVEPALGGLVAALHEDRLRRPVLRLAGEPPAALEDEHVDATAREREGRRAAAHARADDDHVGSQRPHAAVSDQMAAGASIA